MATDQAYHLKSRPLETLDKTLSNLKDHDNIPPTFRGIHYAGQILTINCDNSNFLQSVITQYLSIKIDGADLKVVRVKDISTFTKV